MCQVKEAKPPRGLESPRAHLPVRDAQEERRTSTRSSVRNAVIRTCHVLNLRAESPANWNRRQPAFRESVFLFVDYASRPKMVLRRPGGPGRFARSPMRSFIFRSFLRGHNPQGTGCPRARVASSTSRRHGTDVMIAEFRASSPVKPGPQTSLSITKLSRGRRLEKIRGPVRRCAPPNRGKTSLSPPDSCSPSSHQPQPSEGKLPPPVSAKGDPGHGSGRCRRSAAPPAVPPTCGCPLSRCYWGPSAKRALQPPEHHTHPYKDLPPVVRLRDNLRVADDHRRPCSQRRIASSTKRGPEVFPGSRTLFLSSFADRA